MNPAGLPFFPVANDPCTDWATIHGQYVSNRLVGVALIFTLLAFGRFVKWASRPGARNRSRNFPAAMVGSMRSAVLPHEARCWNRPTESLSPPGLLFRPDSVSTTMIEMTASRTSPPLATAQR